MDFSLFLSRAGNLQAPRFMWLVGVAPGFYPTGNGGQRKLPHLCWLVDLPDAPCLHYVTSRGNDYFGMNMVVPNRNVDAGWFQTAANKPFFRTTPALDDFVAYQDHYDGNKPVWHRVVDGNYHGVSAQHDDGPKIYEFVKPGDIGMLKLMSDPPTTWWRNRHWPEPDGDFGGSTVLGG